MRRPPQFLPRTKIGAEISLIRLDGRSPPRSLANTHPEPAKAARTRRVIQS
jgi:hypothetical protein